MLILTRKVGESIRIGDDVIVSVLRSAHPSVIRLGITAPKEVIIIRNELENREFLKKVDTEKVVGFTQSIESTNSLDSSSVDQVEYSSKIEDSGPYQSQPIKPE